MFTDREDKLRQGISSENMRRLRTNAGDKVTSNAKEVALAAIHNTKYYIPIDHPILNDHNVFYPRTLSQPLSFEITFASVADVVVFSDQTKPPNYKITNLELEYQCIQSEYLAKQAAEKYQVGRGFLYEKIILRKTFNISKNLDSVINEHVNVPRRSMTGILCLFTEESVAGTRGSEKFVNPMITSVNFNIDGMPNKLYSNSMISADFWESLKKRFVTKDSEVKQIDFYADNKFALWIDLRTHPDNDIHGGGFLLNNTRDGVTIEIRRQTGGLGSITCNMFLVADAVMEIESSNLHSIKY